MLPTFSNTNSFSTVFNSEHISLGGISASPGGWEGLCEIPWGGKLHFDTKAWNLTFSEVRDGDISLLQGMISSPAPELNTDSQNTNAISVKQNVTTLKLEY